MRGIRITVARVEGSAPRGPGTSMMVWPDRIAGTIGGGALEWEAMAQARRMLSGGQDAASRTVALGPGLGQCCGGAVTLEFARAEGVAPDPARPLWIWGAGHVGRALVAVLGPLPDLALTWIDDAAERFPPVPDGVTRLVAADMARATAHAPGDARHLVVTYSHEIDLALCHALLDTPAPFIGLIGSDTKWARFRARLGALGHGPAQIGRITCPIGQKILGKHPQAIAVGVAAALLNPDTQTRGSPE